MFMKGKLKSIIEAEVTTVHIVLEKVTIETRLRDKHQDLAKEWHPAKNGEITPRDVVYGSNKKSGGYVKMVMRASDSGTRGKWMSILHKVKKVREMRC